MATKAAAIQECIRTDPKVISLLQQNPQAPIDGYDFQCQDCFLNQHGVCTPVFKYASSIHEGLGPYGLVSGMVESISISCKNYLSITWTKSGYCHRPPRSRCHKTGSNKCYQCEHLSQRFHSNSNRSQFYSYEPTTDERIDTERFWIEQFSKPHSDSDYNWPAAIRDTEAKIALLNQIKNGGGDQRRISLSGNSCD